MTPEQSRPLIFGEVLFDHFPDGQVVLGGAPFNVAWHLQAFGQSPLFISRVGDDPLGRQIRTTMLDWGMDTSGLQLDSAHPTGTVDVSINNNEPSYDIVENRAYDFIDHQSLPPLTDCKLIYHGSLALRNPVSRHSLEQIIQMTALPTFVDINLRPPWWSVESVMPLLENAQWVKLNHDELLELFVKGNDINDAIQTACAKLQTQLLYVTQGEAGAIALAADGSKFQVKPAKTLKFVDTVGAGDAFSSVLLLGQLHQWLIEGTMQRAQDFASAIVGQRGATVNNRDFYNSFIHNWELG